MIPVLVTGAAGFIGSNFCKKLLQKKQYRVFILDNLTYAGDISNLDGINKESYTFIEGSICDLELLQNIFNEYQFEKIIHFAAETHVDNSITVPDDFIATNINGTYNLVKMANSLWMKGPFKPLDQFKTSLFLHVSTDEVFGSLDFGDKPFTEESPYRPNSPYSASKASSDLIVRSFNKTYGLNTIITNCSNNFGENQHLEKFIPKVIYCCFHKEKIPVYGDGKNIRDWISVSKHCLALINLLDSDFYGESFCIGGDNEVSNLDLVKKICLVFNNINPNFDHLSLIEFVDDRLGHDLRYSICSKKYKQRFDEGLDSNFNTDLKETINWYISRFQS